MDFTVAIVMATIALVEVKSVNIDPSRQASTYPSYSPDRVGQQRYATKEIILYLTPSQIKALQEGKGFIRPPQPAQSDKHNEAYVHSRPLVPTHYQNGHSHLAHSSNKPANIEELPSDNFVPIIPSSNHYQTEKKNYNGIQPQNPKRFLQPIPFFPYPSKETLNTEAKDLPAAISQSHREKDDTHITHQELKEKWLRLLNENIAHFKDLQVLSESHGNRSNENKMFHNLSQNDERYYYNKDASDVYNSVRYNNENQLQKQQGLLNAETIANSPSVLVQKEINIKHSPGHISHVPAPVLVPITQPSKVPRAYVVPLDIGNTGPLPIVNSPAPIEIEKHIPLPAIRNVLYVDHVVPLGHPAPNGESFQIHNYDRHH